MEQLSVSASHSPGLPQPAPRAPPAPSASPGGPCPALTRSGGSAARTGEGGARRSVGSAGEARRRRGGHTGEGFKPRAGQCKTSGCARLYPMPPRRPRAAAELGRVSRVGRRRGGCDTVTSAARQPCAGGGGPGQPRQRRPPAHGIDGAAVTHTRELVTGRHRAGGGGGSAPPLAGPTANSAPRPGGLTGRTANGSSGRPAAAERPLRPSESSEDTPPPSAGEGRGSPAGRDPRAGPVDDQSVGRTELMGGADGQWEARGGAAGRWSRRERGRWPRAAEPRRVRRGRRLRDPGEGKGSPRSRPPSGRWPGWIGAGPGAAKVVSRGRKESGVRAWCGGSRGGPAGGGEKLGEGAARASASLRTPGSGSGELGVACL